MYLSSDKIFNIYKRTVLKESPDNIQIGQNNYNYDDPRLGNYTGFLTTDGEFAMSREAKGHSELIRIAKAGAKLIHNMASDEAAAEMIRRNRWKEFRIWPKFDVFSMWVDYSPRYAPAAIDAIKAINKNPEGFIFDIGRQGAFSDIENGMKYEEFVGGQMTDEIAQRETDQEIKRAQNQKMLGDYKLGNLPQKTSSRDTNSFNYRREGD